MTGLAFAGETAPPGRRDDAALAEPARQVREYFAGARTAFEIPLRLAGTDFDREVWRAVAAIGYGETATYGDLAERIGRPGAARAVGAANGRNPIALIVPCHRVIGAAAPSPATPMAWTASARCWSWKGCSSPPRLYGSTSPSKRAK